MVLYLILLISTLVFFRNEINQIFKEPLIMINDCMAVQRSARAMSVQSLNIWTIVTISLSLLYFIGIQVSGALPAKLLYPAATYHLLTTFFDYSFMANLRDCSGFDFLRWRVDAYLRCSLYAWIFIYLIINISIQPVYIL